MSEKLIHRAMPLPEILVKYPGCRQILDRYGLLGCGGPYGPQEPLWFFARAHRIPEAQLLCELEQAAQRGADWCAGPANDADSAAVIYRRFFKAAIVVMFTFGCVFGGINLAILAAKHQLASLDMRALIWSHAHAQVAGWVTFFVMGFAYQAFPRFKLTALRRPRLAAAIPYVMAPALAVRCLADLWQKAPFWKVAGITAGAVELAAVLAFVWIITQTLRSSQQAREPYEKFIYAALGWMVVAFAFDLWVFAASSAISGYSEWVRFIGAYDGPWRDLQLLGFAGGMILGVSQRFLPFLYGFGEVSPRASNRAFYLWNLSVAGNIAFYSLLIHTRRPAWGAMLELSLLGLLAAVLILIRSFHLYSENREQDRSLPFIRAAYGWAAFALALLMLMPLYHFAVGRVFSHAYFGAYRHAFTVGFISMMIVGVSSKVVPILAGINARERRSLAAPFWLLNTGNGMRVLFQILTDTQPWAYPWMALSAWIEVAGLIWWAIDLWRTMDHKPSQARGLAGAVTVTPQTLVSDIISRYPAAAAVFEAFGFSLINNPVARLAVRSVTLQQACRLKHIQYEVLAPALLQCIEDSEKEPRATHRTSQLQGLAALL
ncbi:MAG TPA: NnrS family protein [Bryobacterales bacterium]|nr:NnrS family protein [Bryobacterales bacterium]